MNLLFATNNLHKLEEIRSLIDKDITISGLSESGFKGEIPEDFPTIEQNASQKSRFIFDRLHQNCFADDTGLEVEALGGQPGVYSARFSRIGEIRYPDLDIAEGNIKKLLFLMENETNRNARFRTVISLIIDSKETLFEGIVNGKIARSCSGTRGFGYDPVFIPDGENCSFAEMGLSKKNLISHRAIAMEKLITFLRNPQ